MPSGQKNSSERAAPFAGKGPPRVLGNCSTPERLALAVQDGQTKDDVRPIARAPVRFRVEQGLAGARKAAGDPLGDGQLDHQGVSAVRLRHAWVQDALRPV